MELGNTSWTECMFIDAKALNDAAWNNHAAYLPVNIPDDWMYTNPQNSNKITSESILWEDWNKLYESIIA